jgi:hypothetical protein
MAPDESGARVFQLPDSGQAARSREAAAPGSPARGTYGSLWDRETPKSWSNADDSAQVGLGLKYGITSSLDAEITVNPDFSQVESDQFQVEANQRFPIFYNEKRPFFMEVSSLFSLAGLNSEGNFWSAVHTRNIVDPAWEANCLAMSEKPIPVFSLRRRMASELG